MSRIFTPRRVDQSTLQSLGGPYPGSIEANLYPIINGIRPLMIWN
jgi:hypothetical protein